jgi:hypothetical protein
MSTHTSLSGSGRLRQRPPGVGPSASAARISAQVRVKGRDTPADTDWRAIRTAPEAPDGPECSDRVHSTHTMHSLHRTHNRIILVDSYYAERAALAFIK